MTDEPEDSARRKTLVRMTVTAGGLASAGAAVPFLASLVYRGSPAPTNLVIPPHRYLSPEVLLLGDDGTA